MANVVDDPFSSFVIPDIDFLNDPLPPNKIELKNESKSLTLNENVILPSNVLYINKRSSKKKKKKSKSLSKIIIEAKIDINVYNNNDNSQIALPESHQTEGTPKLKPNMAPNDIPNFMVNNKPPPIPKIPKGKELNIETLGKIYNNNDNNNDGNSDDIDVPAPPPPPNIEINNDQPPPIPKVPKGQEFNEVNVDTPGAPDMNDDNNIINNNNNNNDNNEVNPPPIPPIPNGQRYIHTPGNSGNNDSVYNPPSSVKSNQSYVFSNSDYNEIEGTNIPDIIPPNNDNNNNNNNEFDLNDFKKHILIQKQNELNMKNLNEFNNNNNNNNNNNSHNKMLSEVSILSGISTVEGPQNEIQGIIQLKSEQSHNNLFNLPSMPKVDPKYQIIHNYSFSESESHNNNEIIIPNNKYEYSYNNKPNGFNTKGNNNYNPNVSINNDHDIKAPPPPPIPNKNDDIKQDIPPPPNPPSISNHNSVYSNNDDEKLAEIPKVRSVDIPFDKNDVYKSQNDIIGNLMMANPIVDDINDIKKPIKDINLSNTDLNSNNIDINHDEYKVKVIKNIINGNVHDSFEGNDSIIDIKNIKRNDIYYIDSHYD